MNTNEPITAYPLSWPTGWKRTPSDERVRARFSRKESHRTDYTDGTHRYWSNQKELSIADALRRLQDELRGFGVEREDIIISTNLDVRNDGLPRSGQRAPSDPGASVYWSREGEGQRCMAIDQYDRVADNLAAIAATLAAMRAIERHGGAEILNRAFEGFASLPAAGGTSFHWWDVLGVNEQDPIEEIKAGYRNKSKQTHPDLGGSAEEFIVIQKAYDTAKKERAFA